MAAQRSRSIAVRDRIRRPRRRSTRIPRRQHRLRTTRRMQPHLRRLRVHKVETCIAVHGDICSDSSESACCEKLRLRVRAADRRRRAPPAATTCRSASSADDADVCFFWKRQCSDLTARSGAVFLRCIALLFLDFFLRSESIAFRVFRVFGFISFSFCLAHMFG